LPSKQKAKYLRRIKVEEDVQENGNGALDGDAGYVHGAAPFGVEELEYGNFAKRRVGEGGGEGGVREVVVLGGGWKRVEEDSQGAT